MSTPPPFSDYGQEPAMPSLSVFRHRALGLLCVRCTLGQPADVPFLDDVSGLAAHLELHRASGQHVPDWVFEDLAPAASCQTVDS